ncbi:MAG: bifunctional nicotinamidase/pyrazinamidase [Chlamydiae bacterium]|nr:bifunctional nicotinamidase/pyrazinamidase [Chlamydiota bacterium]
MIKKKSAKALIITDIQRDFLPGGALGISGANFIVPIINQFMEKFEKVVVVRDWHPKNHVSFASTHDKRAGEVVHIEDVEQILWPDHCIQNTPGANFADDLHVDKIEAIFEKGTDLKVDSYSAFFDAKKHRSTGLFDFLKKHDIKDLCFVGLATDYCILYSALDAIKLGFKVTVIIDACRAINRRLGDEQRAIDKMKEEGVKIITSDALLETKKK